MPPVTRERLIAFVRRYAEPAEDLVARLAELDAEADAILRDLADEEGGE